MLLRTEGTAEDHMKKTGNNVVFNFSIRLWIFNSRADSMQCCKKINSLNLSIKKNKETNTKKPRNIWKISSRNFPVSPPKHSFFRHTFMNGGSEEEKCSQWRERNESNAFLSFMIHCSPRLTGNPTHQTHTWVAAGEERSSWETDCWNKK